MTSHFYSYPDDVIACPTCDADVQVWLYHTPEDRDCGIFGDSWEVDNVVQTCTCEISDDEILEVLDLDK